MTKEQCRDEEVASHFHFWFLTMAAIPANERLRNEKRVIRGRATVAGWRGKVGGLVGWTVKRKYRVI